MVQYLGTSLYEVRSNTWPLDYAFDTDIYRADPYCHRQRPHQSLGIEQRLKWSTTKLCFCIHSQPISSSTLF